MCGTLLFLGSACAASKSDDNCIANCDSTAEQATTGQASTGPGDPSIPGGDSLTGVEPPGPDSTACEAIQNAELAIYEANSSCTTLLDCQHVPTNCFPPGVPAACTGVALNNDADLDAWNELDALAFMECDECVFEGDCGSFSFCNEENRCDEASFVSEELCETVFLDDAETFLATNTACIDDEDCIAVPSCLTEDDTCQPVAMNTDANLDDWDRLDVSFRANCERACTVTEACEADARCGDAGFCEPVL